VNQTNQALVENLYTRSLGQDWMERKRRIRRSQIMIQPQFGTLFRSGNRSENELLARRYSPHTPSKV
jgi:hypothetical protein